MRHPIVTMAPFLADSRGRAYARWQELELAILELLDRPKEAKNPGSLPQSLQAVRRAFKGEWIEATVDAAIFGLWRIGAVDLAIVRLRGREQPGIVRRSPGSSRSARPGARDAHLLTVLPSWQETSPRSVQTPA